MTRSIKKSPVIKDKTGRWYNKIIRRIQKSNIRDIKNLSDIESYNIRDPKEIVNDYDVCDFVFNRDPIKVKRNYTLKEIKKLLRK